MSQPSIFWWQRYGTLAQMAQAAVALLGFVAILFQINEIRTGNRAASARQAFLGYTDLAFKNPRFASPDYERIKAGDRAVVGADFVDLEHDRHKTEQRHGRLRHLRQRPEFLPECSGQRHRSYSAATICAGSRTP